VLPKGVGLREAMIWAGNQSSLQASSARSRGVRSPTIASYRSALLRLEAATRVTELDARKRSVYSQLNRATPAGCLTPMGYTAYRQTGPGGLPLAHRLSEGLGFAFTLRDCSTSHPEKQRGTHSVRNPSEPPVRFHQPFQQGWCGALHAKLQLNGHLNRCC
jgi:hypothetical protein